MGQTVAAVEKGRIRSHHITDGEYLQGQGRDRIPFANGIVLWNRSDFTTVLLRIPVGVFRLAPGDLVGFHPVWGDLFQDEG